MQLIAAKRDTIPSPDEHAPCVMLPMSEKLQPNQALIGNRYRLFEMVGTGGMGTVYRAQDRLTRQIVALKRVRFEKDQTAALSLANEFRSLATLRHPNIIPVLDYGFDAGVPYFTMRYLSGGRPITAVTQSLDWQERIHLLVQLADALAYLHRRGIVHRDLKPENALVDEQGELYVLDFGLAMDDPRSQTDHTVAGTLTFMAPEVLRGGIPSPYSDLYAFGLIAMMVLTGEHPWQTHQPNDLINAILTQSVDTSAIENEELRALLDWMLSKSPAERLGDAHQAARELRRIAGFPTYTDLPYRESYLRAARFVGREAERAALQDALQQLHDGHGSAWLIGGESGVGKSRLLDEVRIQALVSGLNVLRAQGDDNAALPYQSWADVIARLALTEEIDAQYAAILRGLVPNLHELVEQPIPQMPAVDNAPQRLADAIVSALRGITEPTVLLYEDLHRSKRSIDIVRAISGFIDAVPLLVIAAYRNDERPDLHATLPDMQHLVLGRLNRDEIKRLTAAMIGEAEPPVVDLLLQETEGNTFFLVETIQTLAEEVNALDEIGRMTLPSRVFAGGVRTVVERRLDTLPDWARPLLQLAAVRGRQIDLKLLAHLRRQRTMDESLERWLTTCVNAAVFSVQEDHYQFAHDKLREGVLRALSDEQQRDLNAQVALAIEAVYEASERPLAALVKHWASAQEPVRAAEVALRAARTLRFSDPLLAKEYLEQALRDLPPDHQARAEVHANLGQSLLALSDDHGAEEQYRLAKERAEQAHNEEILIRALDGLGAVHAWRGEILAAEPYYEEALALAVISENPAWMATQYVSLGDLLSNRSLYGEAERHYRQALALEQGDPLTVARAYNSLGVIAYRRGDYRRAREYFEKGLQLRESAGMQRQVSASLNNLGVVAQGSGQSAAARDYYDRSYRIKVAIGDRLGMATALNNIGVVALNDGEDAEAEGKFRESLAIAQAIDSRPMIADNLNNLGVALSRQNRDLDEAESILHAAARMYREMEDRMSEALVLSNIADLQLQQAQLENARATLHSALHLASDIGAMQPLLRSIMGFGAWAARRDHWRIATRLCAFVRLYEATDSDTRIRSEQLLRSFTEHLTVADFADIVKKAQDALLETIIIECKRL